MRQRASGREALAEHAPAAEANEKARRNRRALHI